MKKRSLWAILLIGWALMACQPQTYPVTTMVTQPGETQIASVATPAPFSALQPLPAFSNVRLAGSPLPSPVATISLDNAGQVGLLAQWGNGRATQIAWSPDGLRIAVGSTAGVLLYDAVNLRELGWLEQGEVIAELDFSADGKQLAVASGESARIYEVEDGSLSQVIQLFRSPPDQSQESEGGDSDLFQIPPVNYSYPVGQLTFTPDGRHLAIVYRGSPPTSPDQQQKADYHWVGVWTLEDSSLATILTGEIGARASIVDLAISQDGDFLGAASSDGTLRVWRLSDGGLIGQLNFPVQEEDYRALALSPELTMVASGMEDGSIRLFRLIMANDSVRAEEMPALVGHGERVRSLDFSPDGKYLASGGGDRYLRLWQTSSGRQEAILRIGSIFSPTSFSPQGNTLIYLSDDIPYLWRPVDGNQTRELNGFSREVSSLAFNSSRTILASGSDRGGVRLWSMADGSIEMEFDEKGQGVSFIADDTMLAIVRGSDVSLWELANMGWRKFSLTDYPRIWPIGIAFAPDGSLLAKGVEDGNILIWQTSTGNQIQVLKGHTDGVNCVSFSPDGTLLASAADDGTVRIWNVSQGSTIHSFDNHAGYDCGVAFSPDGKMLSSTSAISGIKLWNVSDGLLLREMPEIISTVTWLTFSPDGELIAGGLENGTVRLWNVATGFQVRTLEGHIGRINALVFSPDGRYLASASEDGTIRIWGAVP
jgi:WD40 repeat protein